MEDSKTSESCARIGIIGAGLTGCMAALLLNKLGYTIELYEKRSELQIPVSNFPFL